MRLRTLRARSVVLACATGFCVATAAAGAAGPVTVYTSKQPTAVGKVLVSGSGRTLYHYASEKKNVVRCIGSCARIWPPLVIGAGVKPIAGPGTTASLLGTVKRPDGKLQVTYRGLPLYLFSGDKKAGDVKGQGNGGSWHALAPSGAVVTKAVKASTGSTAGKGSTGSGSGGSGSSGGGTGGTGSSGGTGSTGVGGSSTSVNCDQNPDHPDCGM
jgi:predicted lipoprotein with Yx(FWY)xxD motif